MATRKVYLIVIKNGDKWEEIDGGLCAFENRLEAKKYFDQISNINNNKCYRLVTEKQFYKLMKRWFDDEL